MTVLNAFSISLKFVHKVQINNIPPLVQIMAWRWPGDKDTKLCDSDITRSIRDQLIWARPQQNLKSKPQDVDHIDELVQERHNSSALTMELRLSYTNPSIWYVFVSSNPSLFFLNIIIIHGVILYILLFYEWTPQYFKDA